MRLSSSVKRKKGDSKPPKMVKSFNGQEIELEQIKLSLKAFPTFCQKSISYMGEPFLTNCVMSEPTCGCKIVGNGTLQFPLTIKFCDKHNG